MSKEEFSRRVSLDLEAIMDLFKNQSVKRINTDLGPFDIKDIRKKFKGTRNLEIIASNNTGNITIYFDVNSRNANTIRQQIF